jgi:hypothetical protein
VHTLQPPSALETLQACDTEESTQNKNLQINALKLHIGPEDQNFRQPLLEPGSEIWRHHLQLTELPAAHIPHVAFKAAAKNPVRKSKGRWDLKFYLPLGILHNKFLIA